MPEKEPHRENEEQQPEFYISDERFMEIYRMLRNSQVSEIELRNFAIRYTDKGSPTQRIYRKEHKEAEAEKFGEIISGIKDMSDEELKQYSKKYFPEYYEEEATIFRKNPFADELSKRKNEREETDRRKIEELKSQIPDKQQEILPGDNDLSAKTDQQDVEKKPWWQFWG